MKQALRFQHSLGGHGGLLVGGVLGSGPEGCWASVGILFVAELGLERR